MKNLVETVSIHTPFIPAHWDQSTLLLTQSYQITGQGYYHWRQQPLLLVWPCDHEDPFQYAEIYHFTIQDYVHVVICRAQL